MKKIVFSGLVIVLFISCGMKKDYNLQQMGKSIERHFKYNDEKQNTITTLELVQPISYDKLDEDQKEQPEDTYLAKFYVRGKWTRAESSLVYNMNDTISCYFDKDYKYLRTKK